MFKNLWRSNNIHIDEKDIFPLIKRTRHTEHIAVQALNNQIIPFPNFQSVAYNQEIWTTKKQEKYGNSYQLYIHSLRVCAELILEYEKTLNIDYLLKVKDIIEAWINFSKKKINPKMLWTDHPTSNRVQVIVHFLYYANINNIKYNKKTYKNILLKHAYILSDPKNYRNYNHGIMMDRALLVLGNILNKKELYKLGYYRAIDTFWHSFSSQGIHLENSPEYHNMVVKMYNEIERYLNQYNDSFGRNIIGYLKMAQEYPKIMMKNDKTLPSIGDSGRGKYKYTKQYKNIFDIEAGISLLQNEQMKMYLTYICGYSTDTHKHKDDLSITFNYQGKDFFVDPGKYNYSKSEIRKYIVSEKAHSSFMPLNSNYTIKYSNRFDRKVALTNYLETPEYTLVKGEHKDFDNEKLILKRTLIMSEKLPLFIIIDESEGNESLDYIQRYNLHEDVVITNQFNNEIHLKNEDTEITIQQFTPSKSKVKKGSIEEAVAVNAVSFGKVKETSQIQFERNTDKDNIFITAIYDRFFINEILIENNEAIVNTKDSKIKINLLI